MKLLSLYINGFGLFRDLKIQGLSPELNVFLGKNESGKSTLLGFFRSMLFGFPDGRSNENPYPPLNGGRHGGIVELSLKNGQRYILERYPGPGGGKVEITKPDRSRGGRDTLNRILGVGNRNLYKNIYAFSLTELQNFETLNTESISESLYSAGAGIDPNGLMNLKSGLEKVESSLFKPGGKKPKINKIISRMMNIKKEKKSLLSSIDEYDSIKSRITGLSDEINHLQEKRTALSKEMRKNDKWISIWPEWANFSVFKSRLFAMEAIDSFPFQGIARLEGLNSRIGDLKKELLNKEEELKRKESEISSLKVDSNILESASAIRQLQKDQRHFEAVSKELLSLSQELMAGEQSLKKKIAGLGPSWSEEKIMKFDLSVAVREEVRSFREKINNAKSKVQRVSDSLGETSTRKDKVKSLFENMDEPIEKEPEKLNRMKRSCNELKGLMSQERLLNEEMRYTNDRLSDLRDEIEIMEEEQKKSLPIIPVWPIILLLAGGVPSVLWFGFEDLSDWRIPVLGLVLILALVMLLIRNRMKTAELQRVKQVEERLRKLNIKSQDLEAEIEDLDRKLNSVQEKIRKERSGLNLHETLSIDSLILIEQKFQDKITQLAHWKDAERSLDQESKRYDEILKDLRSSENEKQKILSSWNEWLELKGFSSGLSPDGVLESLSIIQSTREQTDGLIQLRTKIGSYEEIRDKYLKQGNEVLEYCNRKHDTEEGFKVALYNLFDDFEEMGKSSHKREILLDEAKIAKESIQRYKELIASIDKEIKELLARGGADNEEIFRKRASVFEEREVLKKDMEKCEDSIRRLSSNWKDFDKVMVELSRLDMTELEEKKRTQENELSGIEEQLDLLKREQAKLEEQARQLVNDERISVLRAEEETLKEELSLAAEEWATAKLAQNLINTARARYEKERQPDVISEAAKFLKRLTVERYPSVVAPIGENRIEVISKDGNRKEIEQLSRGTAEQLYLSLRFGFIQEFSKRSGSLPIIMDEILVNFDLERSKATIGGIIELAREHQVLFFTCHPEIVALFRDVDKAIPVLEFSNNEVKELK